MISLKKWIYYSFFFYCTCLYSLPTQEKLQVLYNSLDPLSVSQHLAFYELYSSAPIGKKALNVAWQLLAGKELIKEISSSNMIPLSSKAIESLLSFVNRPPENAEQLTNEETKKALITLSNRLKHIALKGHHVWSEEEMLALPIHEIDIARGLFLSQFGNERPQIESYEALIDLMALQILARIKIDSSPEEKIKAINTFFFDEMGFRFPPRSIYAKNIDLYTFLPSVLDSRRGVCLGVSILYLCIAQRLALPLEMITPPGHIYVRYREGNKIINIETTARGIHIDCSEYLGVNNPCLQKRTIKEVIGLAHFNQASVYWQNREYEKALKAYEKAEPYMRGDPFLKELMGYVLILTGSKEKGEKLLYEIKDVTPSHAIAKNTMAEDYISGKVDAEGIGAIFSKADEDRQSILIKKDTLEKILETHPHFRAGILTLATTWLQLHRTKEALETLSRLKTFDATHDPEVHYYLSALYAERRDYPLAWHHLHQAEAITQAHHFHPKALKELRRELLRCCPEIELQILLQMDVLDNLD